MTPRLLLWCVLVAGCGRFGFDDTFDAPAGDWWDRSFAHRNKIDVHGTKLLERVTDFPMFLHLAPPAFDLASLQPTGADLRFVAADGVTVLPYEIEAISASGVDVWVRVPEIRGRVVDETLWVYYGNPTAPPDLRGEQVWSNDFVAVWHLGSDGRDATSHHLDGNLTGTVRVPGIAATARDIQGGWLDVPVSPALEAIAANGTATWSAWFKPASFPATGVTTVLGRQTDNGGQNDFRIGSGAGGEITGEICSDPGLLTTPIGGGQLELGVWQLIGLVRDGDALRLIDNNVTVATEINTGTVHPSSTRILIGADCNTCTTPNDDLVLGVIDEVRIENVARSDGWFAAEALDLNGGLWTVEPYE